ncbi:nucleoside triphosphate pyrophosphohydrolase [Methylobrevis albus]|uniref:Nucleoside triphosphate pyrophosphohydrolase n=1 Tax=Methylobrevis albus TaxID=2793297 RepID=A0A931MXF7_9HYPH|nr:nucleoside triphosphate pyrophosphohydrolase [Methylobrevis albus]MBH0237022.1 nucleoside triphosphate pyrophosphohydrolase [Methylobrevis albus]
MQHGRDIDDLLAIMAALRDPDHGCPWDVEQDFASIAPYTIEEAYEVADAIARGDLDDLRDELGDLLLQVVFHARMAEEAGNFAFADVVEAITAKMIRRHPHVFGDEDARSAGMAKGAWNRIKAAEKAARRARRAERGLPDDTGPGLLGEVAAAQSALPRAVKLQAKAATVGFDWGDPKLVIAKIREELDELEAEIDAGSDRTTIAGELGDVLFAFANLARHLDVDPDMALRLTNEKFVRRFGYIERALAAAGRSPAEASLDEMEALWQQAKVAAE